MTQAIRKAIGDEAASDFEILFDENLLTKAEFNEKIAQLKMDLAEKLADTQKTIFLWMLGILIPMWGSLIFLIILR